MGLCHNPATAEDLVQETFLRGWRAKDNLRDLKAARAWLYTILRNEHARLYERQRPEAKDPAELPDVPVRGYDTSAQAFAMSTGTPASAAVLARESSDQSYVSTVT